MPECRHCHRVQATCEVRRTKLGFVCKDKLACASALIRGAIDQSLQRIEREVAR